MFALQIEYLTGRCVATSYQDRHAAEWPVHPARVFSALVATWAEGDPPADDERAALEWLERLDPPALAASPAAARDAVTHFVPVNDASLPRAKPAQLARKLVEANEAVAKAEAASEPQRRKAVKKRAGQLKRIHNAAESARELLPEHRGRQPRQFPSVFPAVPVTTLVWPADPPEPHCRALARLASRVVRIGHSSSLVACRIIDEEPEPNWFPDPDGAVVLRVPGSGQLATLETEHARHQQVDPRVLPCRFQRYRHGDRAKQAEFQHSVFSSHPRDWVIFRRVGGPRLPITRAVDVALALRGALMSHADTLPHVLSGHAADGSPSETPHIAYLPLPFVGREHADGSILGVAMVMPREVPPAERRAALRAVGLWEARVRHTLDEPDIEAPPLELRMGRAGVLEVERVAFGRPPLSTLRLWTWCRPARVWYSVTPVALDRNPGDLRSRDPAKAKAAYRAAAATIATACENIGLPLPESVTVLPSAGVIGSIRARRFPPFPPQRDRLQRAKVHARVIFAEPVRGPVLLGAGRYLGLGLFRPVDTRQTDGHRA